MAQDVTLLIKLQDQASGKLGKITNSTKRLEQASSKAQNSIQRTNKGIAATGRVSNTAARGVDKLGRAVRGLAAGFGLFQAGKFVIFKTAELERQTKSLEVLTGSLGNARNIIKELQQFGTVTPFTSAELVETAKRLKAFGFETEQVVDVTKRLADVAGATGADLGGIATAFGQIQAKGRLQGEELLQLQERGVALGEELKTMYGLTGEEFSKAMQKGQISAEAVNAALVRLTEKGGKYANGAIAQSETLSGKFSTLVDNITVLAQHIGNALSPALKGVLGLTNQILAGFNDILSSQVGRGVFQTKLAMMTPGGSLDDIGRMRANVAAMPTTTLRNETSIQETARRLTDISNFVREFGTAIETRRPGGTTQEERQALEGLQGLIQSQLAALGRRQTQLAADDQTVIKPPELLTAKTTGETEEDKAAKALKEQQETAAALLLSKKQEALLMGDITEEQRAALEHAIEKMNLKRQFPNLSEDELQVLRDQLDINFGLSEADKKRLADAEKLKEAQEAEKRRAEELKSVYQGIGDTIASGVTEALQGAVRGTTSLAEAATNMLNNLADQMLQLATNLLLFGSPGGGLTAGGGILGTLFEGALANGGPAMAGKSYLVGEEGPEIFTPGVSGTVTPNHALGGSNIVVNVDAKGSSVQGDDQQGKALGQAIGAAVQAEIVKQKMPGGLLN